MYLRVYRQRFDEEISLVVSAIKELLTHQTKAQSMVWHAIHTGDEKVAASGAGSGSAQQLANYDTDTPND